MRDVRWRLLVFDPLAPPYVRAKTYVDANPPAVLSDEFYNPVQDALARLYGAAAGYSTSLSYEEFLLLHFTAVTPAVGDAFGVELGVITNPGGGFEYLSTSPASANQHGVYRIRGTASGYRGGPPGFQVGDALRFIDTRRWIFRARVRCSKFSVLTGGDPGLVTGLGSYSSGLPIWAANNTGFWSYQWDGGNAASAIPTVDDEWVTLWIACRDADAQVRWYLKRDADPLPILIDTRTLTTAALHNCRRYLKYGVTGAAVDLDYVEIDSISLGVER
jgi:hypothetical protein